MVGTDQPETVALEAELAKLGPAPTEAPEKDQAPTKPSRRKSARSGTTAAQRAPRARRAPNQAPKPAAAPRARARTTAPKIADGMASMYGMVGLGVSMVPSGPAVAGPHVGKS